MTREAHDEGSIEAVSARAVLGSSVELADQHDPGPDSARDRRTADPVTLGPPGPGGAYDSVTVDCDRCSMRGIGCGDCVVTVLLGGPPFGVELDVHERRAIDALAAAGLVPPLRMVEAVDEWRVEPA